MNQEPIAWLVRCKLSGLVEEAEPNEKASNPEYWTDAFPVYIKPSMASLTDEEILEAMRENIYAADGGYVFDTAKSEVVSAGRSLLEKANSVLNEMDTQKERKLFEGWWEANMNIEVMDLYRCEFPQIIYGEQPYACHETQRSWLAWEARGKIK